MLNDFKVFEFPEIEIIKLNCEDVMTTSPDDEENNGALEDEENGAGRVS